MSAKLALYAGFGFVVAGLLLCMHYGQKLALAGKNEDAVMEAGSEPVPEFDEVLPQSEEDGE